MTHEDMSALPDTIDEAKEAAYALIDALCRAHTICDDISVHRFPDKPDDVYYPPGYELSKIILGLQRLAEDMASTIERLPQTHELAFLRAEADREIRMEYARECE